MNDNNNPLRARAEEALREWKLTEEGKTFQSFEISQAMANKKWYKMTSYGTEEENSNESFEAMMSQRYTHLQLDPDTTAFKKALFEKEIKLVENLMKELSPRHRKVIQLHAMKGMPFSQLTDVFNVNRQRVWDIYHDAIYRLIARLEHFHKHGKYKGVPDKTIRSRAVSLKKAHRSKNKTTDLKEGT